MIYEQKEHDADKGLRRARDVGLTTRVKRQGKALETKKGSFAWIKEESKGRSFCDI